MDLRCLFLNCTLKRSPHPSNTQALIDKLAGVLAGLGAASETVRVVDHNVRFGAGRDEGDGDEWPAILDKCLAADILVVATPVWIGDRSSVAKLVAERLDSTTYGHDQFGQHPMYNKVGGALATGEADGGQHAISGILYALSIAGLTIPPNADCYWVGGAGGMGKGYTELDGDRYYFVNERVRWMAHNLVHLARVLKANPIRTHLKSLQDEARAASSKEVPEPLPADADPRRRPV